jgi:hypothetical protein
LAFHVSVAADAAVDHNTRAALMILTEFIRIFSIDIFTTAGGPFLEEANVVRTNASTEITLREARLAVKRRKCKIIHLFAAATKQGACRCRMRSIKIKTFDNMHLRERVHLWHAG